jgi:hypothetical protein
MATQMQKVQSTIGEWHDWQALAWEARRGHRSKDTDLAEMLESLEAESFESALAACHSITARLAGERPAPAKPSYGMERKPPALGDQDVSEEAEKKLA